MCIHIHIYSVQASAHHMHMCMYMYIHVHAGATKKVNYYMYRKMIQDNDDKSIYTVEPGKLINLPK